MESNQTLRVHDLKTWPDEFRAVVRGAKTAEVRKDDRNFRVGDVLELLEYDPDSEKYTGLKRRVLVTHKVEGGRWGLPVGLCVLSITALPPERLSGRFTV